MKKRLIALLCVCTVFLTTGCDAFVEGFTSGWNEGMSKIAAEESAQNAENSSKQPHNDEELKSFLEQEAVKGAVYSKLARFTGYEYKTGISLNRFAKRDEIALYYESLMGSDYAGEKTYILEYEEKLFQDPVLVVRKPETYDDLLSKMYYIGEVNSRNQPNGYGMTFFVHDTINSTQDTMLAFSYIGEFKNGKKDGYGIQFYIPDYYYVPHAAAQLAIENVTAETGLSEGDDGYDEALASLYYGIFQYYLNIPTYEGEFKDNMFSGKGNFSSPYSCNANEFDYDEYPEYYRVADAQMLQKSYNAKDLFAMYQLYVGTFKNGEPDRAKCYEKGTLTHDGKWETFGEPK